MRRLTIVLAVIAAFIAGFAIARRHVPPIYIQPEATTLCVNSFVGDVAQNMSIPGQEQKKSAFSLVSVAYASDVSQTQSQKSLASTGIPILDNYNTKWRGHVGKHYEEWTTFVPGNPHVFVTYDIHHSNPDEDEICITKTDPRTVERCLHLLFGIHSNEVTSI